MHSTVTGQLRAAYHAIFSRRTPGLAPILDFEDRLESPGPADARTQPWPAASHGRYDVGAGAWCYPANRVMPSCSSLVRACAPPFA
jgi:hypothetical protein